MLNGRRAFTFEDINEPIRVKRDRASLGKPKAPIVVERRSLVNLSTSLYMEKDPH